jgi:FMN phosphatase YigB (HAD superfamily)
MVTTRAQNKNKNPCEAVILDLDGTLHDYRTMKLKDRVVDMLTYLKNNDKKIILASLNSNAYSVLKNYNIDHLFDKVYYKNWGLYGTDKTEFFTKVHELYDIPYEHMILFDDNEMHCKEANLKNIKYVKVDDKTLIEWNDIHSGLDMFKIL